MAKPIRKTPTLKGERAQAFVIKMLKTENRAINDKEQEVISILNTTC